MDKSTNFGFETVSFAEKKEKVREVFTSVASQYDLMNDLMSLGVHRLWKAAMIKALPLKAKDRVLDVAGGTGDIALGILKSYPYLDLDITICDLTPEMVSKGRDRAINKGTLKGLHWSCGNAECLPVADQSFDLYTIAFGLRNVADIDAALTEAVRVLKPGGKFFCLEFSKPTITGLGRVYDWYSFNLLPVLGELIAKDRAAYQYLVESIRRFPDQESLADKMKQAGFVDVQWKNLSGGIVALHSASTTKG